MRQFFIAVLAVAVAGSQATAGSRSSGAYSVPADTLNAGGRKSSSASYSVESSVGGAVGVSTVLSPVETIKHGYAGQWFEITSLVVSANPTNVGEGTSRQLTAVATLDDSSMLVLPATQLVWSVVSGPISGVTALGVATAANVFQDTIATVGANGFGQLGTLGLKVLNIGNDDFGSYAGDGLPDDWQVQYFGQNNPAAVSGADPDGDGQGNGFEFAAGTVPTDGTSLFRFRIENIALDPGKKALVFSPIVAGRTYTVESRASVVGGSFAPLASILTTNAGAERTVTDLAATNSAKFYRVHITVP